MEKSAHLSAIHIKLSASARILRDRFQYQAWTKHLGEARRTNTGGRLGLVMGKIAEASVRSAERRLTVKVKGAQYIKFSTRHSQ
jgi:hypothetical protein